MNEVYSEKPNMAKLKKEGYTIVDMHVHSDYSCDGSSKVKDILKKVKRLGMGVAITDHNKIEGSVEAIKKSKGVLVIPGIELRSSEGIDMLLYFYKIKGLEEFYAKHVVPNKKRDIQGSSKLTVSKITKIAKKYKCIVCMAHPYRFYVKKLYNLVFKKRRNNAMLKLFSAMEVVNGKNLKRKNKKAIEKAEKLKKDFIGGSDSHRVKDIGNAVTCSKHAKSVEKFLDSIVENKNILIIGTEAKFSYRLVRPFVAIKNAVSHKIRKC